MGLAKALCGPLTLKGSGINKFFKSSGWMFGERIFRLGAAFFTAAYVARYLGPSSFGQISLVISYAALFQSLSGLGLNLLLVKELSQNKEMQQKLISSALGIRLVAGVIFGVLACCFYIAAEESYKAVVMLAIFSIIFFSAFETTELWGQANARLKLFSVFKVLCLLIISVVKIVSVCQEASAELFFILMSLEAGLNAFCLLLAYWLNGRRLICSVSWPLIMPIVRNSLPFMFSGVAVVVYMRVDQLFIANLLGSSELGLYAAVNTLSTLWHIIPVTLCAAAAPLLYKLENDAEFDEKILHLFRLLALIAIFVSGLVIFLAEFIVDLVYGSSYVSAAPVLQIHILSLLPVFAGVAQGIWLSRNNQSFVVAKMTVVGCIVSIALNCLLISSHGLSGAAWSSVLAQFSSVYFYNLLFFRKLLLMQLGFRFKRR